MSFFDLLYTILISPIQLVFEIIFVIANRIIGHPAYAIVFLSLAMNFLVLPLYRRADAMQEEARDLDQKLGKGVKHIKSTFTGDEKMMILQTYYRQNNYSPVNGLKGSISLLLEIPFFIAAYQFLSHLIELEGVSFGPIANLAAPDALITLGSLSVNVLPILMTAINLVSSAIFLKGFPLKSKIQLYGMALFFLVFLYNSPAGLVFYWTLNNTFSLVKTIFYKIPNPRKVLSILASVAGVGIIAGGLVIFGLSRPKLLAAFLILGLALQLPVLLKLLPKRERANTLSSDKRLFTYTGCFLALLTGVLIPSNVLAASPTEFINPFNFHHPLLYLLMAGLLAAGFFIVWLRIFYGLATEKAKSVFEAVLFGLALCMSVNYLFFGTDFGKLSSELVYTEVYTLEYTAFQQFLNLLLMAVVFVAACVLVCKKRNMAKSLMLTFCIAVAVMSVVNGFGIRSAVADYKSTTTLESEDPEIPLSRDGKNVIVLMVDRAFGGFLPYFLEEKPEIEEMYDGFTFYPNTMSFGMCTNYGVPPVFGGYEYTPVEMNKRDDEWLVDKHNEACKLMPELFYNEGYEVSVCDISYANFSHDPDLSIYDEYEEMHKYKLQGRFLETERFEAIIQNNYRNFFCFSLVKCIPPMFQNFLYYQGNYSQACNDYSPQIIRSDLLSAVGSSYDFAEDYSVFTALPEITVESEKENTFLLLCNETAHDGSLLQLPDYRPEPTVDNSAFDYINDNIFYQRSLESGDNYTTTEYHTCMSAILRLGEWFEYLRENGYYDNSRIIIVADHGREGNFPSSLNLEQGQGLYIGSYNPLFLVKDFDSHGFTINDEFMTNADTPTIALADLIENPVNPFTGKAINSDAKYSETLYITPIDFFNVEYDGNITQYWPSVWFSVSENIFDHSNWRYYGDELTVLPPAELN